MTSSEVVRALRATGWRLIRWGKGDHAIWSGPGGERRVISMRGRKVDRNLRAFVRQQQRAQEGHKHESQGLGA
jgi:predicted RNA binding protein YcfA (HicA-like mRNA interferase family)